MPVHSRLNHEVFETIMHFSDVATIQAMRAAAPFLDGVGAHYLNTAYNTALSRFVHDHVGFRSVLRSVGAVISGSFALHFVDRERAPTWTVQDLDVYAPAQFGRRVVHYLLNVEKYVVVRHTQRQYPFSFGVFKHVVTLSRGDTKIDVIISSSSSALLPIANFWGTHVMNFLTADAFCVAYPQLTLHGHGLLHPNALIGYVCPRSLIRTLMSKYESRGFDFRVRYTAWSRSYDVTVECDGGAGCPRTTRYFGDKHCLIGQFHEQSLGRPWPGGLDEGFTVIWWRGGDSCGGRCEYGPDDLSSFVPHVRTVLADRLLRFGEIVLPM